MRIQSLDFTAKCIKDWHGHVQWHIIHWVRSQAWHDSGPRFCLCTGTTATLIFCNVISHSNPFFPFGAMAADTETSHIEKYRKKTSKRENLHLFTSHPILDHISVGGFCYCFYRGCFCMGAPFLSILKLVVSFFNNLLRDENRYC